MASFFRISRPILPLTLSSLSRPLSRHVFSRPVRRCFSSTSVADSAFLSGANSAFIDEMYLAWLENPDSVHKSWAAYFKTGQYQAPPNLVSDYVPLARVAQPMAGAAPVGGMSVDSARVVQMVRAFQVRGHLMANLDPLGIMPPRPDHEDLELAAYGFSAADLDRTVDLRGLTDHLKGFLDRGRDTITLRQIHSRLKETYCGTIGYEYMHIPSVQKCNWIREKIETREKLVFTREAKLQVLDRLTWADHFEQFLKNKFTTAKRFGLEGAESFIAGMKSIIGRSAELGVDNIVIGMPHRGRLNVLNTVVRKNLAQIFAEFADNQEDDPDAGGGDVKYHLGMSLDRKAGKTQKTIHLSLLANPSHLETVDPVVIGKTRAKQFYSGDKERTRSMGLLLHGDAAFAGQGVVYETFGLSELPEYSTGGTIHMVINNQVGFTTDPAQSRSSTYCTDIAKAFNCPIFHVNGDDPEAVVHVCELAAEWRARFHSDVVIDLVCFRKHGHNEIDEPAFTQPLMYKVIKSHPSTLEIYQKRLLSEGITKEETKHLSDRAWSHLEKCFEESKHLKHATSDAFKASWVGLKTHKEYSAPKQTGLPMDQLRALGEKSAFYPAGFKVHPRLAGVLKARLEAIAAGKGIDWGTAELIAYASLLSEGKHVRLSGQDVERGTFSHRHALLHDQETNDKFVPLNHLSQGQAHFTVTNSHLSEYAVLGFEVGYALENPHALVLWEGQFGDFFNTAQVIVDQYISSGEDKWQRQNGLVMLLPHGYEGAGPEHSSARIERFLQMTNDNPEVIPDATNSTQIQRANWQLCNITSPANFFHALRRQLHREFRKPLVVFTPKWGLRAKQATSSLSEMASGTAFKRVIGETDAEVEKNAKNVKRVLFCSGKVYFDAVARREEKKLKNLAIVRIEQIAPFPFHEVAEEAKKYPNAEVCWLQEEPMNMGAYTYARERIHTALLKLNGKDVWPRYLGRAPSAATAAGHASTHNRELSVLMAAVVEGL